MKIHYKDYPHWLGPYQIADWLRYIGVSEDRCRKIGKYFSKGKFEKCCQWLHEKRQPKHKIKIEYKDTWDNNVLSLIIMEWLKEFKKHLHGAPHVDNEDAPPELSSGIKKEDFDPSQGADDKWFQRWEYVLDEMIFAFNYSYNDGRYGMPHKTKEDREAADKAELRYQNGLRLFGKYYGGLWN